MQEIVVLTGIELGIMFLVGIICYALGRAKAMLYIKDTEKALDELLDAMQELIKTIEE